MYCRADAKFSVALLLMSCKCCSYHSSFTIFCTDTSMFWAQIPPGSTGEVHVPLLHGAQSTISESGKIVWSRSKEQEYGPGSGGVTHMGNDGRFVHYNTYSGHYIFEVTTDRL